MYKRQGIIVHFTFSVVFLKNVTFFILNVTCCNIFKYTVKAVSYTHLILYIKYSKSHHKTIACNGTNLVCWFYLSLFVLKIRKIMVLGFTASELFCFPIADTNAEEGSEKFLLSFDISCDGRFLSGGTELSDDAFLLFWDARSSDLLGGYWESHTDDITQVGVYIRN